MNSVSDIRRIGTIGDVADRYGIDGAAVWELICREAVVTAPDGARVRLVAPAEERENSSLWIVSEVRA